MKIGIFCGSFDPIHIGHAIVANYVLQWGRLDEVWIMTSRRNPLKNDTIASDEDRFRMAELVAKDCPGIYASNFESGLPEPSYTYRTLTELKKNYPEHDFHLIIGSDNLMILDKWKNYINIIDEFKIIVYPRPGYPVNSKFHTPNIIILDNAPQIVMSSTFIRNAIKDNRRLNFFLPEEVSKYIDTKRLYI